MKVLVAYSGGKDSQACLIWAIEKYGLKNTEAVFCDTGWEHPTTYEHIEETTKKLNVKLIIVKSKKYNGMLDLAEKKKRFPSTMARFCTSELKSIPMIDYVLEQKEHLIIIQGIRSQESHSRSKMQKQCRFFKYYFEPYTHDKKGKEKFHTYRKKDIITWTEKYLDDILRPVFDWSGIEVINYILDNKMKPNPLYYEGFKRVGCFPCIMSGHREIYEIIKRYPAQFEKIIKEENRIGSSFFKLDSIPEYARSGVCQRTGKKYAKGEDVKKYLENKNATLNMFEDEDISCSSYYHLCE